MRRLDGNHLTVCHSHSGFTNDGASGLRFVRSKIYLWLFVLFCLLTHTLNAIAADSNILILLSDNDDVYLDVATTITNATIKMCRNRDLDCQDTNFEISQISSLNYEHPHDHKVIVTLGIKAAVYAKMHLNDNIIFSALIPKNSEALETSGSIHPNQHFLFLDQPLVRSMLLISALSDSFKNIGVMISKHDAVTKNILTKSASELDLSLNIEMVESADQIGASLNRLLYNADILLAVPDTKIHNKSTVSNILISAYRKRTPLVGFSSAYVKAGALAAVYSSPEDIAFHVRDNIVELYLEGRIEDREQMAKYFSILLNTEVARSLDFPNTSVSELESTMNKKSIYEHD
ncbi:MAG: ABC transporter substrate binding protein [Candidatus Thiodiazotropha sp.]